MVVRFYLFVFLMLSVGKGLCSQALHLNPCFHISPAGLFHSSLSFKVGVLRPVQQPGSYWDRSSELPLVGLEPTEVTAYD